ncbi:MAG: DUF1553 domain-containing protein [Acidobacteriota bacterium]|nr:DUF1553 domain-containing protein [Acidobacteriota bacterium]
MKPRSFFCFFAAALVCPSATQAAPIDFDRDIRPIFSDNCFSCHGPDEKRRMANLRLDLKDDALAKVIVAGDSSKSKLFQRISAPTKGRRMPPPSATTTLSEKQVDLVRQWIDQGAKWDMHWAYVAPKRPVVPHVEHDPTGNWPRNPIDNFILARLESEKLQPSAAADKATLLRRVTFDLTGLPPTPAEVDAFLADKSPDAYEKRVDRLLASPRYGERMAMHWLDLARYADTHGYHIDSQRDMWHWRDWVIDAFNHNMPFDEFTVDQLAGDLLPNPTLQQRIATGFNRNHMINFEGGAIPEEYQTEYVVDRVEATSVVWMGTTMGCARCHDHKYDPIKQKDFYRFFAFFNTVPEKGLDGRRGNAEPLLQLPSPVQQHQMEELTREIEVREKAMPETEVANAQADWEKAQLDKIPDATRDGLLAHYELDGNVSDSSGHYKHGRTLAGDPTYFAGAVGKAADFDGETQVDFGKTSAFDGAFTLAMWVRSNGTKEMPIIQKIGDAKERRGFEMLFAESYPIGDLRRGAKIVARLANHYPDNAIEIQTKDPLPISSKETGVPKPWYQVTVIYDGSGKAAGLKMLVNGKAEPVDVIHDTLSGSVRNANGLEIGDKKLGTAYKGQMDDLRIYDRALNAAELDQVAIRQPARATLLIPVAKRAKDQKARLREYYLTYDAPETLRKTYAELKTLRAEQYELNERIPTTMVMAEMTGTAKEPVRETFILGRGDYRNHGEKVTPGVPAMLPPLPKDAPANRLTLAKWLVSPSHPLTSRVAVNRYWQMYFGTGIVKTVEDFGSQGEAPSHPQLLDWLATEFIRTGWDVKAMQRLIVTSATYRQASRVTPELLEKDPENRLLARGPRYRLPAEMVRDNALTVSGLLTDKLGGPSVYPYQPKGLWEETSFGDVYSAQHYSPSHGADLYRRSMYTFWKRTSGPPSLITFDAPDREKCTARRSITNTPLQALVLLNDPTYVEAARSLAGRMMTEAGTNPAKRIRFGFRLATARQPDSKELRVLQDIARKELADFRTDRDKAVKLVHEGESAVDSKLNPSELAAWTTVASVILNLDESITKE